MPPRSKQKERQPEWSMCERCKCYISTRDVDLHAEVCEEDRPFCCALSDNETNLQQLRHCFISCGMVLARLDGMFCEFNAYLV